jgi:PAP2 superfamily
MSTMDLNSLLDTWDTWRNRTGSVGLGGSGDAAAADTTLSLMRTREYLVYGDMPDFGSPLAPHNLSADMAGRPGDAMAWVDRGRRLQLTVMDLLMRVASVEMVKHKLEVQTKSTVDKGKTSDTKSQLKGVESAADLRVERASEIIDQINFNPDFWASIVPLSPARTPYTMELMVSVVAFTSYVVQMCKLRCNAPRPHEYSPRIQPMIPTPGHSTFPGGHSAECTLVSQVLGYLAGMGAGKTTIGPRAEWLNSTRSMLDELAVRIGYNREVAGLHFKSDTEAGIDLAKYLFEKLIKPVLDDVAGADVANAVDVAARPFAWLCGKAVAEWRQ